MSFSHCSFSTPQHFCPAPLSALSLNHSNSLQAGAPAHQPCPCSCHPPSGLILLLPTRPSCAQLLHTWARWLFGASASPPPQATVSALPAALALLDFQRFSRGVVAAGLHVLPHSDLLPGVLFPTETTLPAPCCLPPVSPPLRSLPCQGPPVLPEHPGILNFLCGIKSATKHVSWLYQP